MIESHFQHRGYDVRIKEYHRDLVMYFVRTPTGPITGSERTLVLARRRAIEVVNEYTCGDWTYTTGTVLSEVGDGDEFGRVSSVRRKETAKAAGYSA